MGTILDPGKVIFGHFIYFGHFPIENPIEAEKIFGGGLPIELETKQKLFWQKKWDLIGHPLNFENWVFLVPPNVGISLFNIR